MRARKWKKGDRVRFLTRGFRHLSGTVDAYEGGSYVVTIHEPPPARTLLFGAHELTPEKEEA